MNMLYLSKPPETALTMSSPPDVFLPEPLQTPSGKRQRTAVRKPQRQKQQQQPLNGGGLASKAAEAAQAAAVSGEPVDMEPVELDPSAATEVSGVGVGCCSVMVLTVDVVATARARFQSREGLCAGAREGPAGDPRGERHGGRLRARVVVIRG